MVSYRILPISVSILKLLTFIFCSDSQQLVKKCARHAKAKRAASVTAATEAQYCQVVLVCALKVIQLVNKVLEAFFFIETTIL